MAQKTACVCNHTLEIWRSEQISSLPMRDLRRKLFFSPFGFSRQQGSKTRASGHYPTAVAACKGEAWITLPREFRGVNTRSSFDNKFSKRHVGAIRRGSRPERSAILLALTGGVRTPMIAEEESVAVATAGALALQSILHNSFDVKPILDKGCRCNAQLIDKVLFVDRSPY